MKKLSVNSALCDVRKLTEEKLELYDSITINTALLLTNQQASLLLARHNAALQAASIVECSGDATVKNGKYRLTGDSVPQADSVLIVNGSLEIAPDAAPALEAYEKITVNGKVTCPQKLAGLAGKIMVNGKSCFYPDNAILFDGTIDRIFLMRAREEDVYFTTKTVFLLDSSLDTAALDKITVMAPSACVISSLLPTAIRVFPRTTSITEIPDGCRIIEDELTLDHESAKAYGPKLYLMDNLVVREKEALLNLEYLKVDGTAYLPVSLQDEVKKFHLQHVVFFKGSIAGNMPSFSLTKKALEECGDGLLVAECAEVTLDPELPPELIRERLQIVECAVVRCTREQEPAAVLVSREVAQITTGGQKEETEENVHSINTASCVL